VIADRDSSSLYRRFIQPLVPYAIRGILWYQGEDDVRRSEHYGLKMRGLIAGWRSVWQQGELPFYFVQIPPYAHRKSSLSNLREEQRKALAVANTGMVVISDVVNPDRVHPPDKRPVGERLARLALAKTYGRVDLVYSGPTFVSMRVDERRAILRFGDTGSGLATSDEQAPSDFELAGADGVFHPARARIRGDELVVDGAGVAKPVSVRMGWSNSATPNLMNQEGLPASPFRATRK
jgi:sialate O-acetylesterase